MKSGRSLQDLACELDRQAKSKRDFVADTRKIAMQVKGDDVTLEGVNGGMHLRPIAHGQLASALGIPKNYYDRMLSDTPDLLAANVNRWLAKEPAKKLIRTLDGQVRAILSDSYRPLDNLDLAEAILPTLMEVHARVESCEVTDSKLYIKSFTDRLQGEAKVGQLVQAGAMVSNSEVGQGALQVAEMNFNLACLNGMVVATAVRKAHLGRGARGQDAIEDAREYFRTETRQADDRAFFMKVTDAVRAMFNPDRFAKRLEEYRTAGIKQIGTEQQAEPIVEILRERFDLPETESKGILHHLIKGGDMSAWGVANAVTRTAADLDSYDRATELEALGGRIIDLPAVTWKTLAV